MILRAVVSLQKYRVDCCSGPTLENIADLVSLPSLTAQTPRRASAGTADCVIPQKGTRGLGIPHVIPYIAYGLRRLFAK
jgi:hypothetical protein